MSRLCSPLLGWGGLDQAFDVYGRGRGGDVMGEVVGVIGALKAGSQRLIGDFSTAVGLIWGGRASDVYGSGHSNGCVGGYLSLFVCLYVWEER